MVSIAKRLSLLQRVSAEPVVDALESESSSLCGHQPCHKYISLTASTKNRAEKTRNQEKQKNGISKRVEACVRNATTKHAYNSRVSIVFHINLQHPTISLFALTKGYRSKRQLFISFTVAILPLSTRLIKLKFCLIVFAIVAFV